MSWIQTFTGKRVDFNDLRPEMFCIEDIAHALSYINRFTGHTRRAYSVAEHSVRCVHHLVHANMETQDDDRTHVLLHDASEAYLNDLSAPVKHLDALHGYRELEKRVERMLLHASGLRPVRDPALIKEVDRILFASEATVFFGADGALKQWTTLTEPACPRCVDGITQDKGIEPEFWEKLFLSLTGERCSL